VNYLNSKIGRSGGPSAQVIAIENSKSPNGPVSDPEMTFRCRATLVLANGNHPLGIAGRDLMKTMWISRRQTIPTAKSRTVHILSAIAEDSALLVSFAPIPREILEPSPDVIAQIQGKRSDGQLTGKRASEIHA
jgi:hypothetical protein